MRAPDEGFRPRPRSRPLDVPDEGRRGFLKGIVPTAAVAAGALLTGGFFIENSSRVQATEAGEPSPEIESPEETKERARKRAEAIQSSPRFKEAVKNERASYEADLPIVLARSARLERDGVSGIEYLRRKAMAGILDTSIPAHIRGELRDLLPTLPAVEAMFDNDPPANPLTDRSGAKTRMQVTPETLATYGYTEAQMRELPTEAQFMRRYFRDAYSMLTEYSGKSAPDERGPGEWLDVLCADHFNSDRKEMERRFLAPVMALSYELGLGNAITALIAFAKTPRPGSSAYELYETFVISAEAGDGPLKEHSRRYVPRLFAFAELAAEAKAENRPGS